MEGVSSLFAEVTSSESLLSEVDVASFLAGVTSVESVLSSVSVLDSDMLELSYLPKYAQELIRHIR